MSDSYIFKPPPPPPPKASANPSSNQYTNQCGNARSGRGRGRGGGDRGVRRGGRGGHRGGQQQAWRPQPPPPPPSVPNVHINPAFFTNAQRPAAAAPVQIPITNLFYSAPISYEDVATPVPTQSYSNFSLPPPPKRQKTDSKPDMSHEEWIALNGGMLIGTNLKPPETEDEIAEWIAERKKRFPTAVMKARKAVEEAREKRRSKEEAERRERERPKVRDRKRKEEEEKAKREADEKSYSDSAPEETSVRSRTVFRDDRKKKLPPRKICKTFQQTGKCGRGNFCFHEHVAKGRTGRGEQKSEEAPGRKSLYARFVENEVEHENELMVKFIRYLAEKGALRD